MKLETTGWGTGPTKALFLHGFTGSARSFDHLEPLLGELLSATCVTLPGHGETPGASWDDTVAAITQLLSDRTVLIGYSQGARLALAVAAAAPNRVERLVLESCAPGLRRRHDRVLRRRADEALAELISTNGVDAFVNHWESLPMFDGLRALPVVEQQALRARRSSHTAEGLASALRQLGQGAQPDLWPMLQGLRIPTLLMTGSQDAKYTRLARQMAMDLPMGWRVTFSGSGHAPHLECPAAYSAELRSFLAPKWLSEPEGLAP
ncbi:MAG: 2-succinyl-6-hydroxy-2,4-cyclohexadiene-1-carboxylate synthase [Archangium sp.]|nr:2-succinyl-6-hydroxy-2,4-cyclohexadiene-1-carboxylate synthase [Archangium sp.]